MPSRIRADWIAAGGTGDGWDEAERIAAERDEAREQVARVRDVIRKAEVGEYATAYLDDLRAALDPTNA